MVPCIMISRYVRERTTLMLSGKTMLQCRTRATAREKGAGEGCLEAVRGIDSVVRDEDTGSSARI
jgi:hypothetical protein